MDSAPVKLALSSLCTSALRWRPGSLARQGSHLLAWMLLRAAAQACIVILLARRLGAEPYGQFVAVIATASFFTPFIGLGLSSMVLRNAARDPDHESGYLARAVLWWVRSLAPGITLALGVAMLLLPGGLPLASMCTVIAAELLVSSLTDLSARHQQARQNTHAFGAINAGLPLIRLLGFSLLLSLTTHVSTAKILWAYASCSLMYAAILWRLLPLKSQATNVAVSEPMAATSGLPFSLAAFAMKLQGEFNKPVLAQSGFGLAGSYNAAQRMLDMASLPLLALQEALWPRLYVQANPMRQLRRTGLALLALALILSAVVWLTAPLLPLVLGPSFADAVVVLRLLAWLPLLQVIRALLNFHAIHHGQMKLIGWACTAGAAVSVMSVVVLVPMFGMIGAAIAAYAAEVTMSAALLITIQCFIQKRTQKKS